jgi:5'-3' exonuclease
LRPRLAAWEHGFAGGRQPGRARVLLIVDFSSLLYRAFFSMPETMPAHAVHGVLNMLARAIADRRPSDLAVAVDEDWRPAFRVEAIPSYKTHRLAGEEDEAAEPEDEAATEPIDAQEALGREVLAAAGVAVVGAAGYEADDVIATLAAHATGRVEILSGDRDLFALVRDPDVVVLYPRHGTRDLAVVDEAEITARYGIPGRAYGDYALLRGDPSDGLPGVRGIGEKTAAKLVREHGSLDALLAATDLPSAVARKLEAGRDYLARAQRVIPPVATLGLAPTSLALPTAPRDPGRLLALATEHELMRAVERLDQAMRAVRS